MGDTGFEPSPKTLEKTQIEQLGGAECGAVGARNSSSDPDLRCVVEAWPNLPVAVKANVVAMVKAAQ